MRCVILLVIVFVYVFGIATAIPVSEYQGDNVSLADELLAVDAGGEHENESERQTRGFGRFGGYEGGHGGYGRGHGGYGHHHHGGYFG